MTFYGYWSEVFVSPSCLLSYIGHFQTHNKYFFFLCSGVGAGGGCVEGRSPGPTLSNQSASGREQEAVGEPPFQRVPGNRGRPGETGGWVVCSRASQPQFDREKFGRCQDDIWVNNKNVLSLISLDIGIYANCQSSRIWLFVVTDFNLENHVFCDLSRLWWVHCHWSSTIGMYHRHAPLSMNKNHPWYIYVCI